MASPRTPRTREGYLRQIDALNLEFNLELPNHDATSPSARLELKQTLGDDCTSRIKFLYYRHPVLLQKLVENFEEWARPVLSEWVWKAGQSPGTLPSRPAASSFLRSDILARSRRI